MSDLLLTRYTQRLFLPDKIIFLRKIAFAGGTRVNRPKLVFVTYNQQPVSVDQHNSIPFDIFVKNNEVWLLGAHISPLATASTHINPDPVRTRKLLLHRNEILKLTHNKEAKSTYFR